MSSPYPYDVEFEIVKEGWNEYKLSDGARLRTKLILGKVVTPPGVSPENAMEYSFNTQIMVVTYVPQSKKGTPSGRILTPQEIGDAVVEDLDFEQTKVATNEYVLENGVRIKLRLMLTRVGKTDQFTADGSPLYAVNNQIVPEIKVPSTLRKRESARASKTPIV
ncbi:MAG: hypothetical protein WAN82_05255 [Candidatus Bathyarchaeia archaeon]|jgi:hypothetical protein